MNSLIHYFRFQVQKLNILIWKIYNGDKTLSVDYPLHKNSVVFDVGGYLGDWSALIYSKYRCNIYIFEPVQEFAKKIRNRFKANKKIHVFPFGLGYKNRKIKLSLMKERTSEFQTSDTMTEGIILEFNKTLQKNNIHKIDLISINIEGGEYDLLDHIIKTDSIKNICNLQVQFHPFVKNSTTRMIAIQNKLKKTHILVYQFPFIWESWTLPLYNV